LDLENFLVCERIKIQDEYSRLAVSKVVGTSSGKKDQVQQMIDCWTNAFLQVSVHMSQLLYAQRYEVVGAWLTAEMMAKYPVVNVFQLKPLHSERHSK